jgi:SAM-dependent MidA family methyltransferase
VNPLKARIIDLIGATGPMSIADYMALCLFDPQHGYYTTREPFGRDGDFTTAPEISQMFGELIGVWLIHAWRALGRPDRPIFAEIGPGRGTLSRDIARAIDRLEPALRGASSFVLIEISPRLRAVQTATLDSAGGEFTWIEHVDELPAEHPVFIVGNEIFDAIPLRQYVMTEDGWRERMVALDEDGSLLFAVGAATLQPEHLPRDLPTGKPGDIIELAPARESLLQRIAERIAHDGGAALFVDYGHLQSGFGDTLQALRAHAYDHPFANPGEADLTSHVDFAALAQVTQAAGLTPQTSTQGAFLLALGLLERAGQLGARGDDALRDQLQAEVERLAGPDAMGTLFKVLAFSSPNALLAGFGPPA